jgi:hypothetical protein
MRLHQYHGVGGVVFIEPVGIIFGSGGVYGQRVSFSSSGMENNSVQKFCNELRNSPTKTGSLIFNPHSRRA